jgi:mannose-P-dolichol utilization defect protein 1
MESLEQTLRAVLTPITHRLPAPIQELATMLLGDSCYRSLVHNLTISDSVCMKLAVSKALSLAIVAASSVVKVPQMIKLINSGSAEGVSFIGYLLETASLLVTLVYNVRNKFPFSSFGETAFIVVQNVAICFLVLEYSGKGNMGTMLIAALAGAGFLLFNSDIVSAELLQYLQMGAGAVAALSKLPQIIAIFREGGTGQLSAFTVSYIVSSPPVEVMRTDERKLTILFPKRRSSPTSSAPSPASSPPCKKSPTKSSSTASSPASRSTPSSPCRWSCTGMRPLARRRPSTSSRLLRNAISKSRWEMRRRRLRRRRRELRRKLARGGEAEGFLRCS